MKIKHTPGPWTFKKVDAYQCFDIVSPKGYDIAQTIWTYNDDSDVQLSEDEANARLIASAPELLKALELAIKHIDPAHKHHIDITALIKKAKGE